MKKRSLGILLCGLLLFCFGATALAAEQKPYYITVNLTDNIVTVYEKDAAGKYTVPIKAFRCSGGTETPEGTFQTKVKYEWRALYGNVWGQYATRITGPYLFHSVPYYKKDKSTLEYDEFNKLGTTASAGCIRLTVKDVKWIYDNCPIGTTVKLYRGKVQEPLQPAAVQKINRGDTRRGWDPTDPDAANPWRKGTMQEMWVQSAWAEGKMELYYENGVYYISAANAKKLFAYLNQEISLPAESGNVKNDEIQVSYAGQSRQLNCRVKNGTVYYKLRDAAALLGAVLTWDKETKEFDILCGESEIHLGKEPLVQEQTPSIKEEATFTARLASLFLGQKSA